MPRMISVSVGGIYTVIKTKASITTEELGDQYCLIGPYMEPKVWMEVEVIEPEPESAMQKAVQMMRDSGFRVNSTAYMVH